VADLDGGVGSGSFIASITVRAVPEQIRDVMSTMVDGITAQAGSAIIDWGSVRTVTYRVTDGDTGEEYLQFGMGVNAIGIQHDD
jgi:hypothetical protein